MDLKTVLQGYRDHAHVRNLADLISKRAIKRVHLDGLVASSDAMVLAALCLELPQAAIFILGDREEAAYFQNNLENLLGQQKALLYPSSYKKSYQLEKPDNSLVLQRAEILTRINKSHDHFLVITYPEAVHERVVTKKTLERNTMEIKIGEILEVDFVMEFLQENSFERIDFVYEPGQFAVRGGIVDVYSFAHELPYRIEFNGNKIESIRTFDPSTQLSEQQIGFVTIIPNIQTGLVKEEHESLFDFIPEDTIIYVKDLGYTIEVIESSLKKLAENYGEIVLIEEDQLERRVDDLFDDAKILIQHLEKKISS